jgi:glycosyltransferase involved in cell wall biosynthesis
MTRTQQKPRVLGLYDGLDSGCSYYRLISPFVELSSMGRVYDYLSLANDDGGFTQAQKRLAGATYEMTTLLRPVVSLDGQENQPVDAVNLELIKMLIERVHQAGSLFGGDIDDDMWSVEKHNPAYEALGEHTPERIKVTLKGMDFVTCSTQFLRQRIMDVCGVESDRVVVVPNLIDFDLYNREDWIMDGPAPEPGESEPQKVQLSMPQIRHRRLTGLGVNDATKPVVIGIQGGLSHIEDWKQVSKSLKKVAAKYGKRVRFVIGGGNFDYLKEDLKEATEAGLVWWKTWTPFLQHSETVMSFDINLCPLEPTLFNRSKSAIKYLEAGAAGAASVVSPTVYEDYVTPGATALVAREPDDWFEAICALIDKPEARREMARNAHMVVKSSYDQSSHAYLWHNAYSGLYGRYGRSLAGKVDRAAMAEAVEMQAMAEYQRAHKERLAEMVAS